ncbi:hypothetical protein PFISCL1PPCAC_9882, partial [Pristionchus fissidentatus]
QQQQFNPAQVKMEFTSPPSTQPQQLPPPMPQIKMEYNPSNVKMEMPDPSFVLPPTHGPGGGPSPGHGVPHPMQGGPHGGPGGPLGGPGGHPGQHHGPGGPMRMVSMPHNPHGRPGPYPPMARPGFGPPIMVHNNRPMMPPPGQAPPPTTAAGGHPLQQQPQPPQMAPPPQSHAPPPGQGGGGPPPPPPGVNQPVLVQMQPGSNEGVLIEKSKLDDLAREVEPTIVLEEPVKDALLEYTEEFVDELVDRVCRLATHRGNSRLEARDVELVLEQVFSMPRIPRATTFMSNPGGSSNVNEKNPGVVAHNQRVALIKKTLKKI